MLCDIGDDSWPFVQPTKTVLERLQEDAPDESKMVIEHQDPWSPTSRAPRVTYDADKLEANWELIRDLLSDDNILKVIYPEGRNKLLLQHAVLHGTTRQKLSRLLKRYWKRGLTPSALIDDMDRCGGRGKPKTFSSKKSGRKPKNGWQGIPTTVSTKKLLNIAADWYLADPKLRSLQQALDRVSVYFGSSRDIRDVKGNLILVNIDRKVQPTKRQLQYLIQKERPYAVLKRAKLGEKGFTLHGRDFRGRGDQHVSGPGDAFVIDATTADVYLVSQFDRTLIVGRPTVYFAVDVYSRLIVGIYIGFEHPSWMAAMTLLSNVVTPKVAYCAQFGIEITEDMWPSHHLSSRILGDKGEMLSTKAGPLIVENLGIKIENAPSGRPDFKAYVERRFGTVPAKFKAFTPGYVEKDFGNRGVHDYRLDAALNIQEFTQIIIWAVLQCNGTPITDYKTPPDMVAEKLSPTPLDLWRHGISTKSGALRSFSVDEVRKNVLPRATATVTHKGLLYKGIYYECETAVKNDWFIRARNSTWRVEIAYDPRDLGLIWLCKDGAFEQCTTRGTNSKDFNFSGVTLVEQIDLQERNAQNLSRQEEKSINLRVLASTNIENIAKSAKSASHQAKTAAGISKLSTKNIKAANNSERQADRMGEAGVDSNLNVGSRDSIFLDEMPIKTDKPASFNSETPGIPDTAEVDMGHLSRKDITKLKTLALLKSLKGKK